MDDDLHLLHQGHSTASGFNVSKGLRVNRLQQRVTGRAALAAGVFAVTTIVLVSGCSSGSSSGASQPKVDLDAQPKLSVPNAKPMAMIVPPAPVVPEVPKTPDQQN